jgi:hypothetical protein
VSLIRHPHDATVFAPDLPRTFEGARAPWTAPAKLTVSIVIHAPYYQDVVDADQYKPQAMQGGVGRETSEPRHGQVTRLSQWDFGLTTGVFRLLDIAARHGAEVAVALDEYGCTRMPGFAAAVTAEAGEIVARGVAANVIISPSMTEAEERSYIEESIEAVSRSTGRTVRGWFSPERGSTARTTRLLAASGIEWFGDWPVDEAPVRLDAGLTALPFSLETEDMFALYARGLPFPRYERLLDDTIDQLIVDAETTGSRFLGLNWFGWVLGQACYADVAERVIARLAAHPDVQIVLPSAVGASDARASDVGASDVRP